MSGSPRTLVVLSGGMDSTTLLFHLRAEGHAVRGLGVDYGQRHRKELERAAEICAQAEVPFEVADLRGVAALLTGSALTDASVEVPEGHYEEASMKATVVPNRNMLLLSVALARCVALDWDGVAYAAHAGDHAIYPDCRPAFAEAMQAAAGLCDYTPRALLRPFVGWSKAQIAARGAEVGAPLGRTWSCYVGGERHCGRCGTCVERIEAFHLAGVEDPTEYDADPAEVLRQLSRDT